MEQIEQLIKRRGIRPSDCSYHTFRTIETKDGKKGKVRVLVIKGETNAHVEYLCPQCKHQSYLVLPWKRPFSFRCEKCGFRVNVPRLRDEIKRKKRS